MTKLLMDYYASGDDVDACMCLIKEQLLGSPMWYKCGERLNSPRSS